MGTYSTPEYYHCLSEPRFRQQVYEPEADTFLFLEALEKDQEFLRTQVRHKRCVEVGCGSGTVITHLFAILMAPQCPSEQPVSTQFAVVDVNPVALEATALTWESTIRKYFGPLASTSFGHNDLTAVPSGKLVSSIHTVEEEDDTSVSQSDLPCVLQRYCGDLLSPLPNDVLFDVILFNPPYVPTSMEELQDAIDQKDLITAAWCGGPQGRVVLDRFLDMLPKYLAPTGACYIVLIKENNIPDVMERIQQSFRCSRERPSSARDGSRDLVSVVTITERYTGEHLGVYRITYKKCD